MEIIKPGKNQKGWSTEVKCTGSGNGGGGCGATLRVDESDLYHTYRSVHYDDETFDTFTCINCGVETDLNNVPSQIAQRLPSKSAWKDSKKD